MLIGSRLWWSRCLLVLIMCGQSTWADDVMGIAKDEMWTTQVWFACLTWLYGLFVPTLIPLTNAYADCGRPALNFIERFRLGSVRSVCKWDMTKLNSKLTQMNCITMHKCTEMYSEPEIQNLDDLKPEPERSSWRRDEKVNADSEAVSNRLSWRWTWRCFAFFVFVVFCHDCIIFWALKRLQRKLVSSHTRLQVSLLLGPGQRPGAES